jgi:hypothetical protein
MFRLQPKPKKRRKVPIPSDLREAMQEVLSLIKESKRDPDVNIDFDDAIQIGSLCGGRYQKKPNRFDFRYYPERGQQSGTWYLDLHDCDIEDIADGRLTEITLHCCTSPTCGRKFSKPDGHCDCDYVKDPDFGIFQFPEAGEKLKQRGIVGISESSTRKNVLTILGLPDESGGDIKDSILGYISPWIKYRRVDCQLRFEFGSEDRIRNITVLEKDWEPGKGLPAKSRGKRRLLTKGE